MALPLCFYTSELASILSTTLATQQFKVIQTSIIAGGIARRTVAPPFRQKFGGQFCIATNQPQGQSEHN